MNGPWDIRTTSLPTAPATTAISPYSYKDKAAELMYQFLATGAAVGVIGLIGWNVGPAAALVVAAGAAITSHFTHRGTREQARNDEIRLSMGHALHDEKIYGIQHKLNGYMRQLGFNKKVRVIDMHGMYGDQCASPNAYSFNFQNDDLEARTAYLGANHALTGMLSPDEVETVMAHEAGHQARDTTRISNRFKKLKTFTATALCASAVLVSPWMLALLPVQQLIKQSFRRHEEFRADRAAAALTGKPIALAYALQKMEMALSSVDPESLTARSLQYLGTHPTVRRRQERLIDMQAVIDAENAQAPGRPRPPRGSYSSLMPAA